jgi:3-hydroxyisobutyrate dehydrogenase
MCGHLLAKGYPVTLNTRTKKRAASLVERGAAWADSPKSVGERSDIVCTIVGFPSEVREVYFGAEGLLSSARAGP